uniref:CSON011457 protein n=1 Tax=Culicoides sonorensis TaxID=179676 RepID=A0A336K771_CULSO
MEKRIALEKRGRTEDQITELNLDNCRSTNIEGLTDAFTSLESLSLINVGLVSLKNFPKLRSLRKLELSDNRLVFFRISNGLVNITSCENIKSLNLSGNRIKEIDELQSLADLKCLEVLDLFNNEVTNIHNYRETVFGIIPSLKYLDGYDKNDEEAPSDADDDEANHVDEDEESDHDSSDNEVSLAEVYNDQLQDDSSEYNAQEEEGEDEIESESDESEDETRGTKRKIDE